jgi:hypothetical protein
VKTRKKGPTLLLTLLVIACTKVNYKSIKIFIITFDLLEMSANGNTLEGYQWVDGWPVSPSRPRPQQQPPSEPASTEKGEMAVETDVAAEADNSTVHSVVRSANNSSLSATKQSETAYQVNDFDPSLAVPRTPLRMRLMTTSPTKNR